MKRRTLVALISAIVLPMLASLILVTGLADRPERLNQLPAAIVNLDEGTTMTVDGKEQFVPFGRLVAAELVSPTGAQEQQDNLDWELIGADKAKEGLQNGDYYAVLTIPATFSSTLATIGTADAKPAVISVQSNDSASAVMGRISQAVARAATARVSDELTNTLLDQIYLGFDQMGEGLDKAADGSARLSDGAGQLADGSSAARDGAGQLAEGTGKLAAGAGQVADGTGALRDGTNRAANGVGELSAGAHKLAAGSRSAAQGAGELAAGNDKIADGARQLADGTAAVKAELQALPPQVRALLDGSADLSQLDRVLALLEPLPGKIDAMIDPAEAERVLTAALTALQKAQPSLTELAAQARHSAERMRELAALLEDFAHTPGSSIEDLRKALEGFNAKVLQDLVKRCEASGANPEFCADLKQQVEAISAIANNPQIQKLMKQLTTLLDKLDPGAKDLIGLIKGDGTTPGLAQRLDDLATMLVGADGKGGVIGTLTTTITDLQKLVDALGGPTGVVTSLRELHQLLVGTNGHDGLITMLRAALPQLPQFYHGMLALADGTQQLAAGSAAAAAGAHRLADGTSALAGGNAKLAEGAGQAALGLQALAQGAGSLDDGARRLAAGSRAAHTGAQELAGGLVRLSDGAIQLADGSNELAAGLADAAGQVPRYTDAEKDRIASMGAKPITVADARMNPQNSLSASSLAPFAPLMLWLGAVAAFLILPAVPKRARSGAMSTRLAAWQGLRPGLVVGALQGLLVAALLPLLGVHPVSASGAIISLMVIGAACAAIVQAFQVVAGSRLGSVLALLFLVVQGVALGLVLPWQSAPGAVQILNGALPVGAGAQAVRASLMPGMGSVWPGLVLVALWAAVAFVVTTVSIGRRQTITPDEIRMAVAR